MVTLPSFADREEHLRQRAARLWNEDEDVAVCIAEIDRQREAADKARTAVLAELREKVEKVSSMVLNSCWDDHDGPDGTHSDGSACTNTETVFVNRRELLALLDAAQLPQAEAEGERA